MLDLLFAVETGSGAGRAILIDLVHSNQKAFEQLTDNEKAEIVAEYEEYHKAKIAGYRTNTRSRKTDIEKTVINVEKAVRFPFLPLSR